MRSYLDLLYKVTTQGCYQMDRTGTGALRLFGEALDIDLREGFPLLTTKKMIIPAIVHELLWFLQGSSNIAYLQENGVRIWDQWADSDGELGPVYGVQWRSWPTLEGKYIDQIADVIKRIKEDPNSRRLVVSAWNVGQLEQMHLPPCHLLFQFDVYDGDLSCQVYQRSADVFLGVPFNIASYALLTHMIAKVCGLAPARLRFAFGNIHLYCNHLAQAWKQLERTPKPLPVLKLKNRESIFDFQFSDIEFFDYDPYPFIQAPISV